jgi:hypothetical protein
MRMLHKGGASIMKTLSISKKDIAAMSAVEVEDLATQRPELVEPYIHLLDLEPYDEA